MARGHLQNRESKEMNDLTSLIFKIENVRKYLAENWDSPDSEEICEILGIEAHKTLDVEVVVKGIVSVKVPLGFDVDDLHGISATIDFDFDGYEVETLSNDLDLKEVRDITEV